jgi:pimeloyl-ACP methyl ester carboxylesterase
MVIHGFGASPAWFNARFFGLRELFEEGYDILLYTLPFHGSRRGDRAVVNGAELFAHGLAHLSEAVLQGVHDARVLLRHLRRQGVGRIGVTGLSLGGYHAALLAAAEPDLDMVVPNAAVTSLHEVVRGWFPATLTVAATRRLARLRDDDVAAALAVHSPLTYRPIVPRSSLMIVAGLGDRLAEPAHSERLWEHWGRPEIHWFPGSHVLHFGRGAYREAMRRRMGSAR